MSARRAPKVDVTEEAIDVEVDPSGSLTSSLSGEIALGTGSIDITETDTAADPHAPTFTNFTGMMGTVEQLSQVIGARPAGTEEEQQAGFFIEKYLKEEAGLPTETEEFNCNPAFELPRVICCVATAVLAILTIFLPLTIVPALVLTIIFAVLFALETFGITPISNLNKKGISQNIVARFVPGEQNAAQSAAAAADALSGASSGSRSSSRRKRKIIFVAHYDTGKVRAELKGPLFSALNIIHWIELVGVVLIPIILFIRLLTSASDALLTVLTVLISVSAAAALLPVISFILHQTAQYNNGANCNASGVAVMAEVARRIGRDIPALTDTGEEVVMVGEETIRESGYVPEGAVLTYDATVSEAAAAGAAQAEAEFAEVQASRTGAAGAAPGSGGSGVDAIFEGLGSANSNSMDLGADVRGTVSNVTYGTPGAVAEETTTVEAVSAPIAAMAGGAAGAATAAGAAGTGAVETAVYTSITATDDDSNVPDWFKRGKAAANQHKAPRDDNAPTFVQRSRFADALDAAAASSAEAAEQAARVNEAPSVAEQRLQQMRASIMGQAAGAQSALHQSVHGDAPAAGEAQGAASGEEVVETAVYTSEGTAVPGVANESVDAVEGEHPTHGHRPTDVTAAGMGVDGYLASTMDSPDYATAAAQEAAAAAEAANVAANASAEATIASATASALANDAAQLAAEATDTEVSMDAAQKAAIADRTMGFIPVAIDREEIYKENEALKQAAAANAANAANAAAAASASAADSAPAVPGAQAQGARKRREIALPSLTGAIEGVKARLQDAPIDEEAGSTRTDDDLRAERLARQERLSASLPSTSKNTRISTAQSPVEIDDELSASATGNINVTAGAFIDASSTSSFEPVGDELVQDMNADEIYVEDADDSDYVEQITHTGALAGPGYVDMPKSRAGGVFGRLRKGGKGKRRDKEVSLKDSLGLDDDFDARKVGAARGGWESFREDDDAAGFDAFETDFSEEDEWSGGAFSKLKQNAAEGLNRVRGRGGAADGELDEYAEEYYDEYDDYGAGAGYAGAGYDGYNDPYAERSYGDYDGYAAEGYESSYGDAYDSRYDASYEEEFFEESVDNAVENGTSEGARNARRGHRGEGSGSRGEGGKKHGGARAAAGAAAGAVGGVIGGLRSKLGKSKEDAREHDAHDAHERSSRSRSRGAGTDADDATNRRTRKPVANPFGDLPLNFAEDQSQEREAIQQFKGGAITTEIWFVALGAELADNAGIRAFLADHGDDLRGSVIIDLNGIGAGTLSIIEEEGMFRPVKVSSRLKRYANKAASALGFKLGKAHMLWRDSAAYVSTRHGYQTLHVAGIEHGKPAYCAEADDILANVNETLLQQNANFVMELIHNI